MQRCSLGSLHTLVPACHGVILYSNGTSDLPQREGNAGQCPEINAVCHRTQDIHKLKPVVGYLAHHHDPAVFLAAVLRHLCSGVALEHLPLHR